MECKDIEELLLQTDGNIHSPEVLHHLGHCPACKAYQQILIAVSSSDEGQSAPSEECDRRVIMQVNTEIRRQTFLKHLSRRLMKLAAVLAVCAGLLAVYGRFAGNRSREIKSPEMVSMVAGDDSLSSWIFDCMVNSKDLDELEEALNQDHTMLAFAERPNKEEDNGIVFDDAIDLEHSLEELEMVVFGL